MKTTAGVGLTMLVCACSAPNAYRLAPGELKKLEHKNPVLKTSDSQEVVEVERIKLKATTRKSIAIDEFFAERPELLPPPAAQVTLLTGDEHMLCINGLGLLGFAIGVTTYVVPVVQMAQELADDDPVTTKGLLYMALWGPLIMIATTGLGFGTGYGVCPNSYDDVTIVTGP